MTSRPSGDFGDKKIKQCRSKSRSADFATFAFVIKFHEFLAKLLYRHRATAAKVQSDDLTAFSK